jgi:hypothetical protein
MNIMIDTPYAMEVSIHKYYDKLSHSLPLCLHKLFMNLYGFFWSASESPQEEQRLFVFSSSTKEAMRSSCCDRVNTKGDVTMVSDIWEEGWGDFLEARIGDVLSWPKSRRLSNAIALFLSILCLWSIVKDKSVLFELLIVGVPCGQ